MAKTKKVKKSQVIVDIVKKLSPLDKLVADMKKKEGNKKPGTVGIQIPVVVGMCFFEIGNVAAWLATSFCMQFGE